jgi:hypothetical protein
MQRVAVIEQTGIEKIGRQPSRFGLEPAEADGLFGNRKPDKIPPEISHRCAENI